MIPVGLRRRPMVPRKDNYLQKYNDSTSKETTKETSKEASKEIGERMGLFFETASIDYLLYSY